MYSDADHKYDIRVPNPEIRRKLVELERPHHDEDVLYFLHFELEMSSGEIGALFGVARQTIQKIVREFSWTFHEKRGGSRAVEKSQRTLGDYEITGLADFL